MLATRPTNVQMVVTLSAIEEKFWTAFCHGIQRTDLLEHHLASLGSWAHAELEEVFLSRTREEWEAFNEEHDCCIDPVLEPIEAVQRAEAGHIGAVYQTCDGEYRFGLPARFVGHDLRTPDRPEAPGQSTQQCWLELGLQRKISPTSWPLARYAMNDGANLPKVA